MSRLAAKKADLMIKYSDKHPEVQRVLSEENELKRQADVELVRIADLLRNEAELAETREKKLTAAAP